MSEEIDALFRLPLNEFTTARNALASRLNKAGHPEQAAGVKSLGKPSISAWVVNQLFWRHNAEFNNLIDAGRHLIGAQTARLSGKAADIGKAQSEQREAISTLARWANSILHEAGHNPTPEMMRRIGSTLEALSAYFPAAGHDAPRPGRLIEDVDPPGFESLAALIPGTGLPKPPARSSRVIPFRRPAKDASREQREQKEDQEDALAKTVLRDAERTLREAQKRDQTAAAARNRAAAAADEAARKRFEAEESVEKARQAEGEARDRLDRATAESEAAATALENAERAVEKARKGGGK